MFRTSLFKMVYKSSSCEIRESEKDDPSARYEAADLKTKIDFWSEIADEEGYVCTDVSLRAKLIKDFIEHGHPSTWQNDKLGFREVNWASQSHFFHHGKLYEQAGLASNNKGEISCIFDKEWEQEFPYKN